MARVVVPVPPAPVVRVEEVPPAEMDTTALPSGPDVEFSDAVTLGASPYTMLVGGETKASVVAAAGDGATPP